MFSTSDIEESVLRIKQALEEEGRPINEFTEQFEKDNGIRYSHQETWKNK